MQSVGATADVESRDAVVIDLTAIERGRAHPRVSVVIPALNEARNLPHLFARLPVGLHEVILVDGGSVDGTVDVARELLPGVRIVHQNRRGKGNALACGFAEVTGDIIVMLDADMSADPAEIDDFVGALVNGAHFAKGSRFVDGGGSEDITRLRAWGNRWLNRLVNVLYGSSYTDLCYGYNAFWTECLPPMGMTDPRRQDADAAPEEQDGRARWGDGFEIEALIHARVMAADMVVAEVPSYEWQRMFGSSNLHAFRDGFRVLRTIGAERKRLRHTRTIATTLPSPWSRFSPSATHPSTGSRHPCPDH